MLCSYLVAGARFSVNAAWSLVHDQQVRISQVVHSDQSCPQFATLSLPGGGMRCLA